MGHLRAVAKRGFVIWRKATVQRDNITMGVAQDQGSLYVALVGGDPYSLYSEPVRSIDVIVVKKGNEGAICFAEDCVACTRDAKIYWHA